MSVNGCARVASDRRFLLHWNCGRQMFDQFSGFGRGGRMPPPVAGADAVADVDHHVVILGRTDAAGDEVEVQGMTQFSGNDVIGDV